MKQLLKTYNSEKTRRENEQLRKKRLEYVGISLSNILSPENPSGIDRKATGNVKSKHRPNSSSTSASSSSSSSSEESSSSEPEEDEPIYRLRNRRQTNFSYRFNEFDDLINSAIQVYYYIRHHLLVFNRSIIFHVSLISKVEISVVINFVM